MLLTVRKSSLVVLLRFATAIDSLALLCFPRRLRLRFAAFLLLLRALLSSSSLWLFPSFLKRGEKRSSSSSSSVGLFFLCAIHLLTDLRGFGSEWLFPSDPPGLCSRSCSQSTILCPFLSSHLFTLVKEKSGNHLGTPTYLFFLLESSSCV